MAGLYDEESGGQKVYLVNGTGFIGPEGPQGETGPPGDTGAQGDSFNWAGVWTAGTYNVRDVVSHEGSSYVALTTTTEEPPHADWDLVAAAGITSAVGGETGAIAVFGEDPDTTIRAVNSVIYPIVDVTGANASANTAAIQAALDTAWDNEAVTVMLPPGKIAINGTLVMDHPGQRLIGSGHSRRGGLTPSWANYSYTAVVTSLVWTGSSGGTIIDMQPPAEEQSNLTGMAVLGLNLIGSVWPHSSNVADTGLYIASVHASEFDLHTQEFGAAGVHIDGRDDMAPGSGSSVYNTFRYVGGRQDATVGNIIKMTGIELEGDSYNNLFMFVEGTHKDGVAIDLGHSDSCRFDFVRLQRIAGGTAVGILLRAASYADGPARDHWFGRVYASSGGMLLQGTETATYPVSRIRIDHYDTIEADSVPTPYVGDGATVFWHDGSLPVIASRAPFAYPMGFDIGGTYSSSMALAVESGGLAGAVAVPIVLSCPMRLQRVMLRQANVASLRSAEWGLYLDNGDITSNKLVRVASGTYSFTPSGADNRASAASGAPVMLGAGLYWFVLRNTSSTYTFDPATAVSGNFNRSVARTNSAVAALDDTIDISAWSGSTDSLAMRLDGRIAGEASAFG